jgi:hypothetical protein
MMTASRHKGFKDRSGRQRILDDQDVHISLPSEAIGKKMAVNSLKNSAP